jgi:signal transduction histidine kinase
MRTSIAKKLIIYFLFLSIFSTAVVGFYSYEKAHEALISRTYEQLISIRTEKINRLNGFFEQRLKDISLVTNLLGSAPAKSKNTVDINYLNYLKSYLQVHQCYSKIIIGASNSNLCYSPVNSITKNELFELSENQLKKLQPIIKNKLNHNRGFIFELHQELDTAFTTILVGQKYIDNNNREGIVLLSLNPQSINRIMFEDNPHNGLGKSGEAYLVGQDQLMRSNSRFLDNAPYNTVVNTTGVVEALHGKTNEKRILDYRGISVFSSYSPISIAGINWGILAEIDVKEAMVPIYNIRNNIIYLSVLISLFLAGIAALLARYFASPIKRLKQETEKIAQGEYGKTIKKTSNDEIGDLINAFNFMTVQLKEQSEHIETERLLRLSSMIDGQEMERQRLSRELHDSLGQMLLAIKMKLDQAIHSNNEKSRKILQETQVQFSNTIQEIRNISNNLMPAVLNEFGIITGLKNLCAEFSKNTNILVNFSHNAVEEHYSKRINTYLYRIAQEALNNTLKHANASQIDVDFYQQNNNLYLTIYNNGISFSNKHSKGNGISNMKERTLLLGGEFIIGSGKDNLGCELKIKIPIYNGKN